MSWGKFIATAGLFGAYGRNSKENIGMRRNREIGSFFMLRIN